ncbi:LOW QUALITY PROTEIN: hypothetical protein U9M48_032409 [Paspalum notatum var. saurae]|uniref:Integrase catalytic domain-containing protein n=1 Tax=Paspalum notatum var. saurae TaxID=547442 RepID=A0AAQ3U998_PASNO
MATTASSSLSQLLIPVFDGNNYGFWRIKMRTLFLSQDLLDLVEEGYPDETENMTQAQRKELKENRKEDAKALLMIQQGVTDSIFPRVAAATKSKEAREILKLEFQGSEKVMDIKIQNLLNEFENLSMKHDETIQDFITRVTNKYKHVVAAIEESKDLKTYSFNELIGSLHAHDERINRKLKEKEKEKVVDQAFQVMVLLLNHTKAVVVPLAKMHKEEGIKVKDLQILTEAVVEAKVVVAISVIEVVAILAVAMKIMVIVAVATMIVVMGGMVIVVVTLKEVIGILIRNAIFVYGHLEKFCWNRAEQQSNVVDDKKEENRLFLTCLNAQQSNDDVWFIDSGCSNHMTSKKEYFFFQLESLKKTVYFGDNKPVHVEEIGAIAVHTKSGKKRYIPDVFYVPSLAYNLFSVGQLMGNGYKVIFDDGKCMISSKSDSDYFEAHIAPNKLFPLKMSQLSYSMVSSTPNNSWLWHMRFGHLSFHDLQLLNKKNMVIGLPSIEIDGNIYESCVHGKQHRVSFPVGKSWRAHKPLQLVHADICGPMQTPSLNGSFYFLLFVDDFSRKCWVYFLQHKSEAFSKFMTFKALVEKESGHTIHVLRTDRGIKRQLTASYTPQQNGIAERKNRTVVEMARSMLKAKNLPNSFWAEAVATVVYLLNHSPTKAVWNRTPYEAWYGSKPDVRHLKVFGCIAYAHINSEKRQKLDDKSEKCIFIGYSEQTKGYRVYNPITKRLFVSRDVIFDENAFWD